MKLEELFQPAVVQLAPWPDAPHRHVRPQAAPAARGEPRPRNAVADERLTDEQFAAMVDAARREVRAILEARGVAGRDVNA